MIVWLALSAPSPVLAQNATATRQVGGGWIGAATFSPDGRLLALGCADGHVRVVDGSGQGEPRLLKGQADLCGVAIAPDGRTLAAASYDGTVRMWDLLSGKATGVLSGHRGVATSVAFTPDGKYLATGGIDTNIILWDFATARPAQSLTGHKSWINAIVCSSSGMLATASSDNTIRLWQKGSGAWEEKHRVTCPEGEVRSLAFSPDGKTLAAGVRYGFVKIIDVASKRFVASTRSHNADVWAVAFSPDGKTLASGDGDWDRPGDVRLWSSADWKETRLLKTPGEVLCLAYRPDGKALAAGCWDGSLRLWDLTNTQAKAQDSARWKRAATGISLTFGKNVSATPFTGRVFVIASRQAIGAGAFRQNWLKPEPFFAQDVRDWQPGAPLEFLPDASMPGPWSSLSAGKYYLQAVLDMDRGGQNPLTSAGNGYSKPLTVELGGDRSGPIALTIDQVIPERAFKETERVKLIDVPSKLLTAFHGKPMRLRAGVVLPRSYSQEEQKRYPVIYEVPGFSGDHHMAFLIPDRKVPDSGVDMIHVVLDATCRLGHHVFADSANNGPCGQALTEELIPAIEKKYRCVGAPVGRFVTGHSSGGWSSLWLQVTYPDFFGGVWSTAPDPVDFRDFQKVNIYQDANLFRDEKGQDRPLVRKGGKVLVHYQPFSDMERVFGRGGQLGSFEAVFSPRGKDGQPLKLWDRTSGAIDPKVAQTWENYDIRLILERNWAKLEPRLRGKLHIYMGAEDTFYLEGATRLLQKSLKDLGSDAAVEIFPGRDHGNLIDAKLRERIAREMAACYRKHGQ